MFFTLVFMILCIDLATDIYVPSLPEVSKLWDLSEEVVILSISINLIGMALSSIFYGIIGDVVNKKNILIWAFILFILGTFGCIITVTFKYFLVFRFIQGLGGGVSYLSFAYLQSFYDEIQYTKKLSILNALISLSPGLGPTIGSYIAYYLTWKLNFLVIFVISCFVLVLMPCCLKNDKIALKLSSKKTLVYKDFLVNKQALSYSIIYILTMSWCWADLSNLPNIYINSMSVKSINYGYYMLTFTSSYILGCLYNNYFLEGKDSLDITLKYGILLVLSSSTLVTLIIHFTTNPVIIHFFKLISYFGLPIILSNSMTKVFLHAPNSSTIASSLLNFFQLLTSSLVCFIIALLGKESIKILTMYTLLVGIITSIILYYLNKGIKYDSIR